MLLRNKKHQEPSLLQFAHIGRTRRGIQEQRTYLERLIKVTAQNIV